MNAHAIAALPQKWLEKHSLPDQALQASWLRSCYRAQAKWLRIMDSQSQMLKLLEENGIKCVIIKGAAAAMAYPEPLLRACGDIDFLVRRSDQERAAEILEANGYEVKYEKTTTKHHFNYEKNGVHFELHRRLGIIPESNTVLIELFERGIENREFRTIGDFTFPVLPVELNGLVLIFHINQHIRTGLGLRQIIDWMMYLNQNDNLEQLMPILKETGMDRLALTVTALCQEYLGLRKMVEDPDQYPAADLLEYIMAKGNFGKKSGEKGKMASFSMVTSNPVRLFKQLQKGGEARWKAARDNNLLRPFAWIYQTGRILHELSDHKIKSNDIIEQRKAGRKQRELIYKLGLEIDRYVDD